MTPEAERFVRAALEAAEAMTDGARAAGIAIRHLLEAALGSEDSTAARRSSDRERQRARRTRCHSDKGAPSLSGSSDLENLRAEAADAPPASGTQLSLPSPRLVTVASLDDPLPPELRATADRHRIRDPARVWYKFLAHHAGKGKPIAVELAWARWCADERDVRPVDTPPLARTAPDDLEARRRKRAEERAYDRERVHAPIAQLLAAAGAPRMTQRPPGERP